LPTTNTLANAAHSPQALPFAEANGKWIHHLPFALAKWQITYYKHLSMTDAKSFITLSPGVVEMLYKMKK